MFARFRLDADPSLFAVLFERTSPCVFRWARDFGFTGGDAQDLVQDTYLTALTRADDFDAKRSFIAWLRGILVNKARGARRRDRRRLELPPAEMMSDQPPPLQILAAEQIRQRLRRQVAALPMPYSEVLHRYFVEGMSPSAIARASGLSASTVRTQVARGIERLRRALPSGLALGALASFGLEGRVAAAVRAEAAAGAPGPAVVPLRALCLSLAAMALAGLGAVVWPGSTAPAAAAGTLIESAAGATPVAVAAPRRVLAAPVTVPAGAARAVPAVDSAKVRVHLIDRATGVPLAGVAIGLETVGAGPPNPRAVFDPPRGAVTDLRGEACFDDVPHGSVRVRFNGRSGSRTFTVSGRGECALLVPAERCVQVRGIVRGERGLPLAGAEIWSDQGGDCTWSTGMPVARSKEDGSFAVAFAESTRTRLWARVPGVARSRRQMVTLDRAPDAVELRLEPATSSVGGQVLYPSGRPAVGAVVGVCPSDAGTRGFAPVFARTDAEGRFAVRDLHDGRWRLAALGTAQASATGVVDVEIGRAADLVLTLAAGVPVRGRVTDADGVAQPGVVVVSRGLRNCPGLLWRVSARCDGDGHFELDAVPPGPTKLIAVVAATGKVLQHHTVTIRDGEELVWNPTVGQPLLEPPCERFEGHLARIALARLPCQDDAGQGDPCRPVTTLCGRVEAQGMQAKPRSWIRLEPKVRRPDLEMRWSAVDAGGGFAFAELLPGDYTASLVNGRTAEPLLVASIAVGPAGVRDLVLRAGR
ncbi:MAG: sigma-70 family RNA polymerase sigma factor [Planctomycetota bacterium]